MWRRYLWRQNYALCSLLPSRWNSHGVSRCFRSKAAIEALTKASEERVPNLVLYNYPSLTGALAALFAQLYHSHVNIQSLILPFSNVEPLRWRMYPCWNFYLMNLLVILWFMALFVFPLRIKDLNWEGLEVCYLLDFFGPNGFATSLAKQIPQ